MIDETPIVPMRIASINGTSGERHHRRGRAKRDGASAADARRGGRGEAGRERRGPWALRREFRSTYRDSLTESENIVAGQVVLGAASDQHRRSLARHGRRRASWA